MKLLQRISLVFIIHAYFVDVQQIKALTFWQEIAYVLNIPFYKAIKNGYTNVVKGYIKFGFDVNKSEGSPLQAAVFWNRPEIITMLLDAGADINAQEALPLNNITPLMSAAERGHLDIVKILLARGANINAITREGLTVDDYAQITQNDSEEREQRKREIQRILRFYKAKQELRPQVEHLIERKSFAQAARTSIEEQVQASGTKAGAKDISEIIKGYL